MYGSGCFVRLLMTKNLRRTQSAHISADHIAKLTNQRLTHVTSSHRRGGVFRGVGFKVHHTFVPSFKAGSLSKPRAQQSTKLGPTRIKKNKVK